MKSFGYTITDRQGLRAMVAGRLAKEAGKFHSKIIIMTGERIAGATDLMGLMNLRLKRGMVVSVIAEGSDEWDAITAINNFFKENL
ncbi:MAG: HPr family phosphocarrier protein [Clostridiales bacterium]|nr:HPr family phosphocarrier protein [Clostridiales bacterium]